MAIEDFFDHRCSIYHTQQESTSPGYGLPGSPKFKYPKQPDLEEVRAISECVARPSKSPSSNRRTIWTAT